MNKKNGKLFFRIFSVAIILVIALMLWVYFGLSGIQKSHIEGNIPKSSFFDEYLSRDLSDYFTKKIGTKMSVNYKLLRDKPEQGGLGAPKFYVFIFVKNDSTNKIIDSGVAMVGANDGESFTIMSYMSKNEIKSNPEKFNKLFPSDVILKVNKDFIN